MQRFFVLQKNRPGLACVYALIDITITLICSCMSKLLLQTLVKILVILNDALNANQIKSDDIVEQLKKLISILELIHIELKGGKHDN